MSIDPDRARDAGRTRADILFAAQHAFSQAGYADTGVREITAMAGVNPALVNRYFGSKEKLFEAALADLLGSDIVTEAPRDRFGAAMVEMLTANRAGERNPLPMMLLACADSGARAIVGRLLHACFIEPLTQWFGPERGAGKAAQFVILASGLTLYREVYPLAALTEGLDRSTTEWLVGAFQSIIDAP